MVRTFLSGTTHGVYPFPSCSQGNGIHNFFCSVTSGRPTDQERRGARVVVYTLSSLEKDFIDKVHVRHEISAEIGYVVRFFRAPRKGPENWCLVKVVERCRNLFLTLIEDF